MAVVIRKPCGGRSASQSRFVSAIASAKTSHVATLQPSATSWRTSSRPIPVPPPVTTAILPAKSFIESFLQHPIARVKPYRRGVLVETHAHRILALGHRLHLAL